MQYEFFRSVKPVSGRSAPEAIVRRLSEAITTGELRPGDKLPSESELAQLMGVALMTLRVALASLRELGMIETVRGRNGGNFISENVGQRLLEAARLVTYSRAEIRDLTDWRRAISGEACALAAERGTEEEFAALVDVNKQFVLVTMDVTARRLADARFHTLIGEAARSERLLRQEIEIQEEITKLIFSMPHLKNVAHSVTRGHDGLMKALFARDSAKARQEMIDHTESTFNWCLALTSSRM